MQKDFSSARRKFVQHSLVVSAGLAISPSILAHPKRPQDLEKITILHTNDTHSNIDSFPLNHPKFPNQGGVARRMTLVNDIRAQEENVLLLDAGDIFQGTPYFNKFNGTLEMKLMSQLKYDAATMGNHDFDAGLEGFHNALAFANFPFLCANYDFKDTILKDKTKPFHIFQKGNRRVGVFGLGIQLEGLVSKSYYGDTIYNDPIAIANEIAPRLRYDEKCDLVICLSHLGHFSRTTTITDPVLAKSSSDIDLIIGGHTHTFMDKPEIHENALGQKVLINQVGWGGLRLGRVDFLFDDSGKAKTNDWKVLPIH